MKKRFVVGLDVGGTNIKFGLTDSAGKILARSNLTTSSFIADKTELINAFVDGCLNLIHQNNLNKKDILGIGIGLPGLIDVRKGLVRFLPNIPGWKDIPLKRILEKKIQIPVFLDNDVNVITLGEWKFGAGVGFKNFVCMTLGTGVGSGLILNNELYRGEGFTAGELGHVPLNENGPKCKCGGIACLERYVGNKPLQEKAARKFGNKNITLEEMDRLAKQGDPRALQFWRETAQQIGLGLVSVVNLLNPKRIIIGGGVSKAYQHLFREIEDTIRKRAISVPAAMVKVIRAKLGDSAGILGTYVLVNEFIHERVR